MSNLREDWIRLSKDAKSIKVNGYSGVGTLFDNRGEHVCIIAANEDALFDMVKEFMPNADVTGLKFQKMTVIQTPT